MTIRTHYTQSQTHYMAAFVVVLADDLLGGCVAACSCDAKMALASVVVVIVVVLASCGVLLKNALVPPPAAKASSNLDMVLLSVVVAACKPAGGTLFKPTTLLVGNIVIVGASLGTAATTFFSAGNIAAWCSGPSVAGPVPFFMRFIFKHSCGMSRTNNS